MRIRSSVLQAWACEFYVTTKQRICSLLTNPSIYHDILELELFIQSVRTKKYLLKVSVRHTGHFYDKVSSRLQSTQAHLIFILKLEIQVPV